MEEPKTTDEPIQAYSCRDMRMLVVGVGPVFSPDITHDPSEKDSLGLESLGSEPLRPKIPAMIGQTSLAAGRVDTIPTDRF